MNTAPAQSSAFINISVYAPVDEWCIYRYRVQPYYSSVIK